MKIGRRDPDMLRFQGEIGKRTGIGEIIIKHKLRVNRDIEKYLFPLETSFMNTPVQTGVDRPKWLQSTSSFLCISYKCLHDFIVSPVFSPRYNFLSHEYVWVNALPVWYYWWFFEDFSQQWLLLY